MSCTHPLHTHQTLCVDHGSERLVLSNLGALLAAHKRPQLVEVDDGAVELVARQVEVAHAELAEVSWMILIEVDPMMMLTTGVTTSTRVLSVLPHTAMASAHVTPLLTILLQTRSLHFTQTHTAAHAE